MATNQGKFDPVDPLEESFALRDRDGRLKLEFIIRVRESLEIEDGLALKEIFAPLHSADAGDVLEALDAGDRRLLAQLLGEEFDYETLTEVDDSVRAELTDALPNEDIARAVRELESDDAVIILEDMEPSDREEILARLPSFERLALTRGLDYPEDTAGRRMQADFVAIPPFWNVGQTIDHLREDDDLPSEFYQIYVVDPSYKLLGTVALDRVLRSSRPTLISDILNDIKVQIACTMDQEEAAHIFERYDLIEVAVHDEADRLVGVLTIDDIVDVIHEEADEDIRRLAGVGEEDISGRVWATVRSRFTWLAVNLTTSILVSIMIGLFGGTIEQMVALAVLMPIVASMGGNAGTQTMTVVVRALAMHEIESHNLMRVVRREASVGAINGLLFALVIGVVAALWFSNWQLGWIIAIAMVVNMLAAALAGILIPVTLDKLRIDPAIASSAFVTTVTDIVGFIAFLGLAAWWFKLW